MSAHKLFLNNILWIFLLGCLVLVIILMGAVPSVSRDALTHHLYIPRLYLQNGGIFEIPHIEFSYYPMNLDLLYMGALYFKIDILPKFIHFSFALATAWMIFVYLKTRINTGHALLGSLFFLSIPVIVNLSTVVYVDLGLVCFLFAALIFLFKWIHQRFKVKPLVISAVFCGLALGTKYNGLVGLFLLGLFVPFVYARYHSNEASYAGKAIGFSLLYVFIALIIFSPWMIRNVVWTGNPIYPLYHTVFNPGDENFEISGDEDSGAKPRMSHFLIRKKLYDESALAVALIPLRVFFQGKDNEPKYFDGRANPFLLLLPIFAFFGIRADTPQIRTEKFLMIAFSVLFLLFACAQTVIRIRYFAPIFPPMAILAMFGMHRLEKYLADKSNFPIFVRNLVIYGIIVMMLGWNANYIFQRFNYVKPMDYLTGKISRDDYIQKYRPEYASMQYANHHLTNQDRILGVYLGNRGYYSEIDIVFSIHLLQNLAKTAESCADIYEGLRKRDITHLIVNHKLFNFWVKDYSLHEKQVLKDFFERHVLQLFYRDGHGLYQLQQNPYSKTDL